jgi:hypothetical protein
MMASEKEQKTPRERLCGLAMEAEVLLWRIRPMQERRRQIRAEMDQLVCEIIGRERLLAARSWHVHEFGAHAGFCLDGGDCRTSVWEQLMTVLWAYDNEEPMVTIKLLCPATFEACENHLGHPALLTVDRDSGRIQIDVASDGELAGRVATLYGFEIAASAREIEREADCAQARG